GLGETPGPEPLAARHARQTATAERVARELVHVTGRETGVARDGEPERGVVPRDALDDEQVGERVGPAAAHLLRKRHPEETELAEAAHRLAREPGGPVPLRGVRPDLALAEVPDRLLDVAMLVAEDEVHQGAAGRTLARIQSTISCVDAPGVKTFATP